MSLTIGFPRVMKEAGEKRVFWLNPIEMLWRHFRREVTHGELVVTTSVVWGWLGKVNSV